MKRMSKWLIVFILLLAVPAVLFAGGGQEEKAPEEKAEKEEAAKKAEPIKLGGVWPLGDITGEQGSKAARLAVEEINAAGGVLGRELELTVIDSELKPEKGAAAIDRLATVDKVDIFLGGMSSGVHLAQIPTLKKYKKVTVWTGAASSKCEEAVGENADWYFHLHPWDYNQGASYAKGWAAIVEKYDEIVLEDWFLAYEEGPFGTSSFDASKVLYSDLGNIEGESFKSAALGGGDYSAVIQHAKEMNPDIFIWAGYDADALPIMEQAKASDFAPPILLGAPPGWPADFGDSPLSNNVMLYGMWAASINDISDVSKKFYDGYIGKYNNEPATYFAPLSYTAVYIIKEAIERAGSLDTDALIAAMEKTDYTSPLGETVTFSPSNIISHQGIRQQKILQWQEGRQEVIWPFQFQTADPVYPFPGWEDR
jgi:branched-chain amino acid transport system substrate-binding protein